MDEPLQPPPLPAALAAGDGISWSCLVSAMVFLALSLAIGNRSDHGPPPSDAVPQPVPDSVVVAVELAPLQATLAPAPAPSPHVAAPRPLLRLNAAEQAQPRRGWTRRQAVSSAGARSRRHQVVLAGSESEGTRRSVRTRAQVRAEYLRSRDLVAALTGEDSGSVHLMRVAAQQRAARPQAAGRRRR